MHSLCIWLCNTFALDPPPTMRAQGDIPSATNASEHDAYDIFSFILIFVRLIALLRLYDAWMEATQNPLPCDIISHWFFFFLFLLLRNTARALSHVFIIVIIILFCFDIVFHSLLCSFRPSNSKKDTCGSFSPSEQLNEAKNKKNGFKMEITLK